MSNESNNLVTDLETLRGFLPDDNTTTQIADTFKLISDPSRLKIFTLLCHTEECVSSVAEATGMSAPAVSHHLRVLRQANLLIARRDGKEVYYSLSDSRYADVVHHAIDTLLGCKCTSCRHHCAVSSPHCDDGQK